MTSLPAEGQSEHLERFANDGDEGQRRHLNEHGVYDWDADVWPEHIHEREHAPAAEGQSEERAPTCPHCNGANAQSQSLHNWWWCRDCGRGFVAPEGTPPQETP